MHKQSCSSDAFTGLEAAIVLIAFVVVAAVFSYVVLGAGFFTSQKSQETVYKSVEQATSNIQMVGNVYGLATTPSSGINTITFSISLTPGAPDADLTKMTVMFSSDTVAPVTYSYGGATSDTSHFSAVLSGTTTPAPSIAQTEQVTLTITLDSAATLSENKRYNVEIRPIKGAVYSFSRTTGAKIFTTNIL
ncbi:MAG: flagellin [Methanoregulaceae archaeon]|nr:MAG: flagellin [Methanoregulaceae archaeon]RPI37951.1 MAG: flagellin [Methanoregulaceae archaeon]